jgi:hypothetical protein
MKVTEIKSTSYYVEHALIRVSLHLPIFPVSHQVHSVFDPCIHALKLFLLSGFLSLDLHIRSLSADGNRTTLQQGARVCIYVLFVAGPL